MKKRKGKERPFSRPLGNAALTARKSGDFHKGKYPAKPGLIPALS